MLSTIRSSTELGFAGSPAESVRGGYITNVLFRSTSSLYLGLLMNRFQIKSSCLWNVLSFVLISYRNLSYRKLNRLPEFLVLVTYKFLLWEFELPINI